MQELNTTRREFFDTVGRLAGSSTLLKSMAVLGISAGVSACDSASGSEPTVSAEPTPMEPLDLPGAGSDHPIRSDWPASVGDGKRVIILGAGIAGMSAAWELLQLGYQCTVLKLMA